jgi:GTP-binding protein HflX
LFERPRAGERAVLVHVQRAADRRDDEVGEFRELAASAGAVPSRLLTAPLRDGADPRYLVGPGKVDEIAAACRDDGAELVLVNHPLTPAQERNLERRLQCRVLDRIGLILDIFAQRASTFEGKLQVELAQLRHLSTRLVRGWTHLERQKGGIGLRGPGEKQLETDRRLLNDRIRRISERLEGVSRRRALSRRARARAHTPVVSLVGYTNAGKSTLFNALTGAGVQAADKLFATLDPTLRRLGLARGGHVVLADTVGFIRDLPHDLVAAFRSTLEETREASLLLHVVDAAAPDRDEKLAEVERVLAEIGAAEVPRVVVFNKTDCLPLPLPCRLERDAAGRAARIWVSARDGAGLEELARALDERCGTARVRRRVRLPPPAAGRLRAQLFALGAVTAERVDGDGCCVLDVSIPAADLDRLSRNEGLDAAMIEAVCGVEGL